MQFSVNQIVPVAKSISKVTRRFQKRRVGFFLRLHLEVPLLRSLGRSSVLKWTLAVSLGTA